MKLGVEKVSTGCMTVVFLSLAEAKDRVMKDNFPLKQEGGEAPQAQGEGAGKCLLYIDATGLLSWSWGNCRLV